MTAGKHWPIDPNTPVTSPFGYRGGFAVPGSADWLAGLHDGTDFGADYGTPVYAAHAGTLTNRLDPGGYGQYVQIDADGIMTQYGHVRDMWIIPDGTWVEPGTWIAGVGSEGMSTGAHLHFRLHLDGQATDPVPWLQDAEWHPGVTTAQPAEAAAYVPTTNEGHVVRWLLDHTGWTPAGVAGVCGNIQQESSFNPTITEGGRAFDQLDRTRAGATAAGYGLCQWSFDRLWSATGLLAWCDAQGYDYSTIDGQLRFMLHEIGQYWPDLGQTLTTATDPVFAAQEFGRLFEGWGIEGARNQYAAEIHARMLAGEFGPLSPATVTTARIRRHIITGDDMSELIEVHKDQPANVPVEQRPHESHWLIAAGVPSRVESDGVAGPVNRHVSELEFYAWLQAWATANNLQIMQGPATVGPAAGRPIFPPAA